MHSSYVYSSRFYSKKIKYRLLVATGCFDGLIRFWFIDTKNLSVIQNVCIDENKLYS